MLDKAIEAFSGVIAMDGANGISVAVGNMTFATWMGYAEVFVTHPNIATNIQDASRLLTAEVLTEKAGEIVDLALRYPDMSAGHNFIGKVNPAVRAKTSVHPVWADARTVFSLGLDWSNDASASEKKRLKEQLVQASLELERIVGIDGGTYINEANPYEPHWQAAFWGSNYESLLEIKRRIDRTNLMVCNRCIGTDFVYNP